MKHMLKFGLAVAGLLLLSTTAAYACPVSGHVICDPTGIPLEGVQINFDSYAPDASVSISVFTDENGYFNVSLPGGKCYTGTVVTSDEQWMVEPASGEFDVCLLGQDYEDLGEIVIGDPSYLTTAC